MDIAESYKLVWDLQDKEAGHFWTRNNAFLLLHGGLLAVLAAFPGDLSTRRLIAIEGFVLALLWMAVLRRGRAYIYRWNRVIARVESSAEKELSAPLYSWQQEEKKNDPPQFLFLKRSQLETSDLMAIVILTILITWVFIASHAWIFAGVPGEETYERSLQRPTAELGQQ